MPLFSRVFERGMINYAWVRVDNYMIATILSTVHELLYHSITVMHTLTNHSRLLLEFFHPRIGLSVFVTYKDIILMNTELQ
jgi:hypothetical protein